nr:TIGR04211 family SH3 domain-containing protein [Shewanella sp. WXL01]
MLSFFFISFASVAQTQYVSDDVFIYIHGGPGTQYRILGSIEAGQPITATGKTDGEFTQIVDHKDREGWVKTDSLSAEPSFRERLPKVEAELAQTKQQLASFTNDNTSMSEQLKTANSEVRTLKAKLAEVEAERDTAQAQVKEAIDNKRYHMWQEGGMIAGIGALIGIILVYLPRPQRRRKERW